MGCMGLVGVILDVLFWLLLEERKERIRWVAVADAPHGASLVNFP